MTVFTGNYVYTVAVTIVTYYLYALTNCIIKVDSHIACRAHAVPLPCSDSAVSFVKVHVVVGNI